MYFEMVLDEVTMLVADQPWLAAFYLVLAKIVGAVLFAPGTPFTLAAGALFGTWKGFLISMIGNAIGALLAFYLARSVGQKYILSKILPKYPKIKEYEYKLAHERGLATVLFLRLVPLFPFNVLNYLLGVTSVSNRNYILGTFFGIIPGTLAFVYFGESIRMLSWINIAFAIAAIVVLIVGGKYYQKLENKKDAK